MAQSTLEVIIQARDKFTATADRILGRLTAMEGASARMRLAGQQIGLGITRGLIAAGVGTAILAANIRSGLDSLIQLEEANAQTQAALKSTGAVAGLTAKDIRDLSEKYEGLNATIDDKVIQSAQNMLLTFTKVRKEAFEPALAAILDMNTRMGRGPGGLQETTIMVGKALQDPVKGLTALRRAGVMFTADQVKLIKSLVASGDILGAQKVIIQELNREFGGSFIAQGETTAGKVAKIGDAFEDVRMKLATAFLPVVERISDILTTLLKDPEFLKGVEDFGAAIAGLFSKENLSTASGIFSSAWNTIKDVMPGLLSGAKLAADALGVAVNAFLKLPPGIQSLLAGGFLINKATGGLLTNLAGLALSSLKTIMAGHVTVIGTTVTGPGGLPGVPGSGPGGGGIGEAIKFAIPVIGGLITFDQIGKWLRENIQLPSLQPGDRLGDWITKPTPLIPNSMAPSSTEGGWGPGGVPFLAPGKISQEVSDALGGPLIGIDTSIDALPSRIAAAMPTPITNVNVNVSASTVVKTYTQVTRYAPTSGSYDGDPGGGNWAS